MQGSKNRFLNSCFHEEKAAHVADDVCQPNHHGGTDDAEKIIVLKVRKTRKNTTWPRHQAALKDNLLCRECRNITVLEVSMPDFNEPSFTSWIVAALAEYLPKEGYAFTPHSRNQGLKDAWRSESCPDLVQPFRNGAALALEVKIAEDKADGVKKLVHYKEKQRVVNQMLHEQGVPLHYCYNDIGGTIRKYRSLDFLKKCMCSTPKVLCDKGGFISENHRIRHVTLDILVDYLVEDAAGKTDLARTLFNLIITAAPQEPGVRTLLLAYNSTTRGFESFDEDALQFITEKVIEFVSPSLDTDNLKRLKQGKYRNGLEEHSVEELETLCRKFCNSFNRSLENYAQSIRKSFDKEDKPSGSGSGGPSM